MTKEEFRRYIQENKPVYLDGATGSFLQQRGMQAGDCPELWILEHKEVLMELQRAYVEAGSNIIYAPTFTANRVKLKEYGIEDRCEEINKTLVAISKEAADGKALVAGDITMTGEQLVPMGRMEFEELIDVYKEQITYLAQAGADVLIVETMMSLQETRAALIAAKETCDLPVLVTMTFEADGRTLYGTDPVSAAVVLESLGASAIGANCSTGPDHMCRIIEQMAGVSSLPIIAKPNAGLPALDAEGKTVYDMAPSTFAEEMKAVCEAGAMIVGGCCGTSPDYIRALHASVKDYKYTEKKAGPGRYLSSERKTLSFGLDDKFIIIGERINPTGKKALQTELKEGKMDLVRDFAENQEECGAQILDVNVGMGGVDEMSLMLKAIDEVATVSNLPLSLDSSHIDVLEAALRRYPGRALVNSVSYEKEKFEKLLPIVAKYGAMFILLPLSDKGLPESLQEKKEIIHTIVDRALELGMKKEDIVVDGLVTTVGANKNAAIETLETIAYCKSQGLATVCGLSNISFGLPQRTFVNSAFLTLAIANGLTMAIANPSSSLLTSSALATDLLLNKEEADLKYIEQIPEIVAREDAKKIITGGDKAVDKPAGQITKKEDGKTVDSIYQAVLKGRKNDIVALTKADVANGRNPKDILDVSLLPAINEVGELFDKGKYFLPQLIASAEAMKLSIEYLEPLLLEENKGDKMPTVVIATVEGDIHDIGKNLVTLMLKNYGFQVIDLGKDVSKEEIVKAAKEHDAQVIALSALMTTTMQQMEKVISLKEEEGLNAKVIVGGAVITQDYADEIGADGYSKDAAEAVKVTKKLLNIL